MGFSAEIVARKQEDGKWRVLKNLSYTSPKYGKTIIPKGFVTDFATTPKSIHLLLPPDGEYKESAALHDYLLKTNTRRSRAASIFLESLKSDDIPLWRIVILFSGVKVWDAYISIRNKIL